MKGLYARENGTYNFTLPDGKRKSTHKKSKHEATIVANIYKELYPNMAAIDVFHAKVKSFPLKVAVRLHTEALRLAEKHSFSEVTANDTELALRQLLEAQGIRTMTGRSFNHYAEEFLESKKPNAGRTHAIKRFKSYLPQGGEENVETIRLPAVIECADAWVKTGLHINSVHWYLGQLKLVFELAILENHFITTNPFAMAQKKYKRKEAAHKTAYTDEEVNNMLQAAPSIHEEWVTAILLARWTGARRGDVIGNLGSEHYDGHSISFIPSKTSYKGSVYVPLLPNCPLKLHLDKIMRIGNYCPKLKSMSNSAINHQFKELQNKAGINRLVVQNKGKKVYDKSFHSFRYTFNQWLESNNVSPEVRQAIVGHSSVSQNQTYSQGITESVILKAFDKISNL